MTIGEELLRKVNKTFPPGENVQFRYKGNDVVLNVDEQGNAIRMFLGKASEHGVIKGDRYSRTMKYDHNGKLIKDHWERKGKAS